MLPRVCLVSSVVLTLPFILPHWTVSPHSPIALAMLCILSVWEGDPCFFLLSLVVQTWTVCPLLASTPPGACRISFLVLDSPPSTVFISGGWERGYYSHKCTNDLTLTEAEPQREYFLSAAGRGWFRIKDFQICKRLHSLRAVCWFLISSHLCLA